MNDMPEVLQVIIFLAPGLLLVQMLYLGGVGRSATTLDRLVLGIALSVPIHWVTDYLFDVLQLELGEGLGGDTITMALALIVGILGGLVLKGDKEEQED